MSDLCKITYMGPSMNPTLRAGDLLSVVPYGNRDIRKGDVIAFRRPGGSRLIVHRVVRAASGSISTRGDNNNGTDPWMLQPEQIKGRVVSLRRNNRNATVQGGTGGRVLKMKLSILRHLNGLISKPLRPFYHILAASGILWKCLPRFLRPEMLVFRKPAGEEFLLCLGNSKTVVGRRRTGEDKWLIRRLFRLFVDEAAMGIDIEKRR